VPTLAPTPTLLPTPTPTVATVPAGALQLGDTQPLAALALKPVTQLADTRIGDTFPLDEYPHGCDFDTNWQLTHVDGLRLTWVRLSVDPMEWETATAFGMFSRWSIDPCQDGTITRLADRGETILMTIVYWDKTLNATRPPDYKNEREVQSYLDYAKFLVDHYKDRIHYWAILNEPIAYTSLTDYLNLVRQAMPVIRGEDPEAKVVAGGSSNLLYPEDRDWIRGLLRSDVVAQLDGIELHPMYGASPQYKDTAAYYTGYPAMIHEFQQIARDHGFTGEWIATEMCWRTAFNPNPDEPWTYTPTLAAKYYARGAVVNRGLGLWAGLGGEKYDSIEPIPTAVRNLSVPLEGATPATFEVSIETQAPHVVSYTFTRQGGARIVALWVDGSATDQSVGLPATVTIDGLAGSNVEAIDVLHGTSQKLTTSSSSGALVVKDLLVKDYPIFLRIGE